MRAPVLIALAAALVSCAAPRPASTAAAPPAAAVAAEKLAADAPRTTALGNTFVAPAGWTLTQRGRATVLEVPEGGSFLVLVDVPVAEAATADAALAAAWAAYRPASWPLKVQVPVGDRDGWTGRIAYEYQTSPNEKRDVGADVRRANDVWTVVIADLDQAVGEKRGSQVGLVFGKLLPRGRTRESFAGRKAHPLDAARVAALQAFVEKGMRESGVPGVSFGLYQGGKVVFSGGFGVRELGKPGRPDGDTRYLIASNTKGLATLMLARLVDAGKLGWETPATQVLPSFRLGSAETTRQVRVKHLICACTGMPRQDMEWILQFQGVTPADALASLGTMQPTSGFGELFQYSNPMAAAAGFLGGHVAHPELELGAAYDRTMQEQVFGPLGMTATSHVFPGGQEPNCATAHSIDMDGRTALAEARANLAVIPVRPAGGAWSTVNDMLRYVAMELAEGTLPGGQRYLSREALLARRAPQVSIGSDETYGMGLMVNTAYGTPVVHHGGDMIGFHSDMIWLPEHGVGAVILTNGDPGWLIRGTFRRKLLEVLFDGRDEAEGALSAAVKSFREGIAAERRLLAIPADPAIVAGLAPRYAHPALGELAIVKRGAATWVDVGEWATEVATRKNPDGTASLYSITPGVAGFELVISPAGLTLRDAQHEYLLKPQR